MWFMHALARRLENAEKSSMVECVAVTPGFVPTSELIRSAGRWPLWILTAGKTLLSWILPQTKSLDQGANEFLMVCTSEMILHVKYVRDLKIHEPSEQSKDVENQERLWATSEKVVNTKYEIV
jgi:hypothetical protein